jgi:hypothetical protein
VPCTASMDHSLAGRSRFGSGFESGRIRGERKRQAVASEELELRCGRFLFG